MLLTGRRWVEADELVSVQSSCGEAVYRQLFHVDRSIKVLPRGGGRVAVVCHQKLLEAGVGRHWNSHVLRLVLLRAITSEHNNVTCRSDQQ